MKNERKSAVIAELIRKNYTNTEKGCYVVDCRKGCYVVDQRKGCYVVDAA